MQILNFFAIYNINIFHTYEILNFFIEFALYIHNYEYLFNNILVN